MTGYFVSWSGGKDCCLALYRAMQEYGKPNLLFNLLTAEGKRSRSHGFTKKLLQQQAAALQIPIQFAATTWEQYEATFINNLYKLKKQEISMGVFGDLKIVTDPSWNAHRKWADMVCAAAGMHAMEPLWDESPEQILQDFFAVGFVAKIIAVNAKLLSADYLGKTLTPELIAEFVQHGIDPCGERGEYHTLVVDGPIFNTPLSITTKEKHLRDGYWVLDID